jgi:[protein-PII] uridylyltransferase
MHEQAEKRTARFGDSVYLLEPDVKNGEGGLRDLDIVNWTAQARWRAQSIKDLVQIGVLAPAEFAQLQEAASFLARVRNVLHYKSPRRSERLGFEAQELVAGVMGYGTGGPGCEQLMSEYYRHARTVANTRDALMIRAEPPTRFAAIEETLENGIVIYNDAVAIEHPNKIPEEPVLVLRAYWEAVHRTLPIDRHTRAAVARALSDEAVCERLRGDDEAATLFRRLVRKARLVKFKRDSILTEFHDVGLLLAMIPEFQPVVGRVHHDIYHVYTVDVHSIAAVDRLRKLCRGELSDEYPVATRLATDIARPQVLFMAALLHDIGKDTGGRAHSERGAMLCEQILRRLGVQQHDIVEVQHLVRKHLRMYHTASRRDIDDPTTIKGFSQEVHGPEGLKELYLLTICDVATTSPQALTSWKARMLAELYVSTLRSFEGLPAHSEERAEKLRGATLEMAETQDQKEFLVQFLDSIPDRYMYANEPAQILIHTKMARRSEGKKVWVEAIGRRAPYVELVFIADDKPGALAMITAALSANRIRVAGAQLYSWVDRNQRKRVLDVFWVRAGRNPEHVERTIPRLMADLQDLEDGEINADELIAQRNGSRLSDRPSPEVRTIINFDNRSASSHTVIEVIAEDRTGLLYRLAKTLRDADMEIALAKINTEGHSVADVFYVCDRNGKKLTDADPVEALSGLLRAATQKSSSA